MTELKCPSCGGKLTPDSKNPNIEFCSQCSKTYTFQKIHSEDTGEAKLCLTPVPDRIAYQPLEKKESKKTAGKPTAGKEAWHWSSCFSFSWESCTDPKSMPAIRWITAAALHRYNSSRRDRRNPDGLLLSLFRFCITAQQAALPEIW